MNLKKIIREEIKNLPSFGEEVCMIVHKSGDYILNYQNKPYILTIDQVREAMMNPLYHPPFSSMYRTCHEMNEALNHYKRVNITNPLFTDESVLDLDFNINDFEVVTYYSGLIPYTNNIFESQDDFDWIRDTTHVLHPGKKYKTASGNIVTIEEYRGGYLSYLRWSVFNVSSKYTYTQERRGIDVGKHMIDYIESGVWELIP
jgi:hypothetical protein